MTDDERRELQLSELEILLEFKRICEENNLRYYLQAGTLLGAVRHKGFIPWDDDIDVSMPREDYDRLASVCSRFLGKDYFFQESSTDPDFPYYFAKIRKNGTEVYEEHLKNVRIHKGQYIDIFPLDVCPRNDRVASFYFKTVTMIVTAYMAKVNPDFVCRYRKRAARLVLAMLSCFPLGMLRWLRRLVVSLPRRLGSSGRLCTVGGAHGYPRETYEAQWFSSSVQMIFENISFNAPAGWDRILEHMYGDYMTPVAGAERQGHFTKTEKEKTE